MDEITQTIINELKFNQILSKLLAHNPADSVFPDQVVYRTISIIALTSGLPLDFILGLKWSDILFINSKEQSQINKKIKISIYLDFLISDKLHKQLSSHYKSLNQPSVDTWITDGLSKWHNLDTFLLPINIALGIHQLKGLNKDEAYRYKNEHLTQILFGRRVFEVSGYSNETSSFLKVYFKLKTNKELFDFLGYSSVEDINYNLSNISLIEGQNKRYIHGEAPSFLNDNKHFAIPMDGSNNYYPFQHFQVFYDFLIQVKQYKHPIIVQGIVVLLLLSLSNGVRLSALLKLKWSDVFNLNQKKSTLILRNKIIVKNIPLKINDDIFNEVRQYFQNVMELKGITNIKMVEGDELKFIMQPNLECPCFISNRGNPLTLNSLKREVRKALNILGFQHTDKFIIKSTLIMYGRRVIELKGDHKPTIRLLKKHFKIKITNDLYDFLFIDYKGREGLRIEKFKSLYEHILYDI